MFARRGRLRQSSPFGVFDQMLHGFVGGAIDQSEIVSRAANGSQPSGKGNQWIGGRRRGLVGLRTIMLDITIVMPPQPWHGALDQRRSLAPPRSLRGQAD